MRRGARRISFAEHPLKQVEQCNRHHRSVDVNSTRLIEDSGRLIQTPVKLDQVLGRLYSEGAVLRHEGIESFSSGGDQPEVAYGVHHPPREGSFWRKLRLRLHRP